MKKLTPLCIIVVVVLGGLGAVAQPTTGNSLEKFTVRFSEPTIQNEDTFVSIALREANSFLMEQDKPLLPSYSKVYTFPLGTTIQSVTVTPQNIQTQTLLKDIEPTPQYAIIGQTIPAKREAPINYGVDIYPSSWFGYRVGSGLYDGELSIIVTVDVYPIHYHPLEKIIESAQQVDINIQYTTTTPQTSPLDNYQFVVIGPAGYSAQISPLITHKIGRGITSKFVSLTEIYDGTYFPVTGRDNQEKIKYFIKNAIESWLTGNILLVGAAGSGSTQLPVRDTHIFIDGDEPDNEIFSSDLYYADIYDGTGGFSSWDTNANNIFGEYDWSGQTDTVDLHPDVYLARLPATSGSQVTACVNKFKTYENTPGYQQTWFTNLVVIGGDSFPDNNKVDEGEFANQKVIDLMTGFVADKLWVTNGKLTGWAPTGVANIKSAINAGCGFVDFSGHGNTNIWATHPHDDFGTWVPTPAMGIKSSDIQTLSNGNKLPIVSVEACSTAKFASDTNCFNWAFLYNSNGGAIGDFGCTGLGYSYVGSGVTQGLVGKLGLDTYRAYKLDQSETFGELWENTLNRNINSGMDATDYKSVEEWQAFGDPTLAIGENSQPPAKPQAPSGPASGKINTEYTYTSSTTDPESDQVSYMFDWGDGSFSSWVGPLNSGATASAKKTYTVEGSYQIKVVAKDSHGKLSIWSDPFSISMPYTYEQPLMHFLERLFEQFPHAFPLLRLLLGY
ncbi:MAG TPA: C25 family cysteine peptidase [Candidatus Thermoplasmatota archaeon]|nr:C25 family cysteine peptidase [Candidatus Thermoplasmatota archaeon]